MTNPAPLRLPDTMQRADIGPYLAGLRTHFGLTLQNVAEHLHIRVRYLQALETDEYNLLPGLAYARGYLASYAEFLGLDAPQVVEICFAAEKPVIAPPPPSAAARQFDAMQWRNGAIIALVCAIALLLLAQLHRHRGASLPETVPPVPVAMLDTHHMLIMPNPRNSECLLGDEWYGCLQDTRAWERAADEATAAFNQRLEDAASSSEEDAPSPAANRPEHPGKSIKKSSEKPAPTAPAKSESKKPDTLHKRAYHIRGTDQLNDSTSDGDAEEYPDHNAYSR